jgi:hypothetical protein
MFDVYTFACLFLFGRRFLLRQAAQKQRADFCAPLFIL